MKKLTRQHFFNHGKPGYEAEKNTCHWCQLRSFETHGEMPISIVNEIDDEPLPTNFRFINRIVYGEGVKPAEDSFRSGCSCDEAGHDCQFSGCSCLEDIAAEGEGHEVSDILRCAYHTKGRNAGLLRPELLNSSDPLYECHESCACSPQSCPNRVVQRGRTVPLQIIRTVNRGWGVRSPEPIRKGQFVDSYIGEVITPTEADRRREASDLARRKDIYLFALDKFARHGSEIRPLEVDGEFMAGPTRFINHSCDPNLRIFARVGDHADTHLHDLAFFAIKEIEKGEELTFDYTDGEEEYDGEEFDPHKMTSCLCGSTNCRGYLW